MGWKDGRYKGLTIERNRRAWAWNRTVGVGGGEGGRAVLFLVGIYAREGDCLQEHV